MRADEQSRGRKQRSSFAPSTGEIEDKPEDEPEHENEQDRTGNPHWVKRSDTFAVERNIGTEDLEQKINQLLHLASGH